MILLIDIGIKINKLKEKKRICSALGVVEDYWVVEWVATVGVGTVWLRR